MNTPRSKFRNQQYRPPAPAAAGRSSSDRPMWRYGTPRENYEDDKDDDDDDDPSHGVLLDLSTPPAPPAPAVPQQYIKADTPVYPTPTLTLPLPPPAPPSTTSSTPSTRAAVKKERAPPSYMPMWQCEPCNDTMSVFQRDEHCRSRAHMRAVRRAGDAIAGAAVGGGGGWGGASGGSVYAETEVDYHRTPEQTPPRRTVPAPLPLPDGNVYGGAGIDLQPTPQRVPVRSSFPAKVSAPVSSGSGFAGIETAHQATPLRAPVRSPFPTQTSVPPSGGSGFAGTGVGGQPKRKSRSVRIPPSFPDGNGDGGSGIDLQPAPRQAPTRDPVPAPLPVSESGGSGFAGAGVDGQPTPELAPRAMRGTAPAQPSVPPSGGSPFAGAGIDNQPTSRWMPKRRTAPAQASVPVSGGTGSDVQPTPERAPVTRTAPAQVSVPPSGGSAFAGAGVDNRPAPKWRPVPVQLPFSDGNVHAATKVAHKRTPERAATQRAAPTSLMPDPAISLTTTTTTTTNSTSSSSSSSSDSDSHPSTSTPWHQPQPQPQPQPHQPEFYCGLCAEYFSIDARTLAGHAHDSGAGGGGEVYTCVCCARSVHVAGREAHVRGAVHRELEVLYLGGKGAEVAGDVGVGEGVGGQRSKGGGEAHGGGEEEGRRGYEARRAKRKKVPRRLEAWEASGGGHEEEEEEEEEEDVARVVPLAGWFGSGLSKDRGESLVLDKEPLSSILGDAGNPVEQSAPPEVNTNYYNPHPHPTTTDEGFTKLNTWASLFRRFDRTAGSSTRQENKERKKLAKAQKAREEREANGAVVKCEWRCNVCKEPLLGEELVAHKAGKCAGGAVEGEEKGEEQEKEREVEAEVVLPQPQPKTREASGGEVKLGWKCHACKESFLDEERAAHNCGWEMELEAVAPAQPVRVRRPRSTWVPVREPQPGARAEKKEARKLVKAQKAREEREANGGEVKVEWRCDVCKEPLLGEELVSHKAWHCRGGAGARVEGVEGVEAGQQLNPWKRRAREWVEREKERKEEEEEEEEEEEKGKGKGKGKEKVEEEGEVIIPAQRPQRPQAGPSSSSKAMPVRELQPQPQPQSQSPSATAIPAPQLELAPPPPPPIATPEPPQPQASTQSPAAAATATATLVSTPFFCAPCNKTLPPANRDTHLASRKHLRNIQSQSTPTDPPTPAPAPPSPAPTPSAPPPAPTYIAPPPPPPHRPNVPYDVFLCEPCNKYYGVTGRPAHLAGLKHQRKAEAWQSRMRDTHAWGGAGVSSPPEPPSAAVDTFFCDTCKRSYGLRGQAGHYMGKKHMDKAARATAAQNPSAPLPTAAAAASVEKELCEVCKAEYYPANMPTHRKSKGHLQKALAAEAGISETESQWVKVLTVAGLPEAVLVSRRA